MYETIKRKFTQCFERVPQCLFSAPGRTELGGNHTDHQHGLVLAGAVNLDTRAAVAANGSGQIRVQSEGYPLCVVPLDGLAPRAEETGTTAALVRGVAARVAALGGTPCGFDAYVESDVLPGSGLSSSAAFEVLMAAICNRLFLDGKLSPVQLAQVGQYAENVYFGKPCGLMDQTASAVGGIIAIAFADPAAPVVTPVPFDFAACGHALCIIDSGADHADLTAEYAAIPAELKTVCEFFGKEYLRDVSEDEFYQKLPGLRRYAGDRAVLRAIHVFDDNRRVRRQVKALQENRFEDFLHEVRASGVSSWQYLQNVIPTGAVRGQALAFALSQAERLLEGRGACRVHGGGFAGTIQTYVPMELLPRFREGMEAALGQGSCHVLSIRQEGSVEVCE